jgi:hypothetical protein
MRSRVAYSTRHGTISEELLTQQDQDQQPPQLVFVLNKEKKVMFNRELAYWDIQLESR